MNSRCWLLVRAPAGEAVDIGRRADGTALGLRLGAPAGVRRSYWVGVDVNIYVVQVIGGRERTGAELVRKHAGDVIEECFLPTCELMKRKGGVWRKVQELLFPGYLFVKTRHPERLAERLRGIPVFMRLLGGNDSFTPLSRDEGIWLEAFTTAKTHVVEMSLGIIEGDTVLVIEGPLKGHEARIEKIDRHKRLAYLDMYMFGRTKSVRIGLEIVRKR